MVRGLLVVVLLASGCYPETPARPLFVDAGLDEGPGEPPADGAPPHDGPPPDEGAPAPDSAPLDASVDDMAPPDALLDDRGPPDAEPPDGGPPVLSPCLPLIAGAPGAGDDELPCLRVRPTAGGTIRALSPASVTRSPGRADERAVVVGGLDLVDGPESPALSTVWAYDPRADRWVDEVPRLPVGRWRHGLGRLDDDGLVVIGGTGRPDGDGWRGASALFRLQPGERAWQRVGDLSVPRADGATVSLPRIGVVYIGGRLTDVGPASDAVDLVPTLGAPVATTPLAVDRAAPAAAPMPDGSIVVVGGVDRSGEAVADVERVGGPRDPVPLPPLADALAGRAAAALPDGVLVVGGADVDGQASTHVLRIDGHYSRVVATAPLLVPRRAPSVTPIGPRSHGWRLVVGGVSAEARGGVVELYDPEHDRFLAFGLPAPWDRPRALHSATAVSVGDGLGVLVVGGIDPTLHPSDPAAYHTQPLIIELTPPEGRAAPLSTACLAPLGAPGPCLRVRRGPSLPSPRSLVAATARSDGTIAVTGGLLPERDELLSDTLGHTPGERVWRSSAPLNVPRAGHAAWQDPDDTLHVLGGIGFVAGGAPVGLASIEVRDPASGRWLLQTALQEARLRAAYVPAAGGLMTIGGQAAAPGAALASVEVYRDGAVEPVPGLQTARTRHVACHARSDADGGRIVVYGGIGVQGVLGSIETSAPDGPAGWNDGGEGPALADATCIDGDDVIDIFGGRAQPDGVGSDRWQRYSLAAAALLDAGRMARARVRPTVSPIGPVDAAAPLYLIVGGELDDADAVVELVRRGDDAHFAYRLPRDLWPRLGHAAVSHVFEARRVEDPDSGRVVPVHARDVFVIGGQRPWDGRPLAEVLVFSVDP